MPVANVSSLISASKSHHFWSLKNAIQITVKQFARGCTKSCSTIYISSNLSDNKTLVVSSQIRLRCRYHVVSLPSMAIVAWWRSFIRGCWQRSVDTGQTATGAISRWHAGDQPLPVATSMIFDIGTAAIDRKSNAKHYNEYSESVIVQIYDDHTVGLVQLLEYLFNPLKCSGIRRLHLKLFSAIQV